MAGEETIQKENQLQTSADRIYELVKVMMTVDINGPEAEMNEISISDGKGGRIFL